MGSHKAKSSRTCGNWPTMSERDARGPEDLKPDRMRDQRGELAAQSRDRGAFAALADQIVHFVGIALEVVELVAFDAVERLLRPVDILVTPGADRLVAHADEPRHGVLAEILAQEGRSPTAALAAFRQGPQRQTLHVLAIGRLAAGEVDDRGRDVERQHEIVS